jgi:hypothetical protein
MEKFKYIDAHTLQITDSEVLAAIKNDDIELLRLIPVKLGLNHKNWNFIQNVSVKLSEHPNENIRGNSFRGFGYAAMNHRKLEKNIVKPVLLRGIKDESEWVRSCAEDALDQVNSYMGWKIGSAKKNKERENFFIKL